MDTNSTAVFAQRMSRRAARNVAIIGVVSCLAVLGFAAAVTGAGPVVLGCAVWCDIGRVGYPVGRLGRAAGAGATGRRRTVARLWPAGLPVHAVS